MPKTRQQKEETVQTITDKLGKAKSVVFTDYKGLNMAQLSELRTKLREVSAEFTITKNTLLKLALNKSDIRYPKIVRSQATLISDIRTGPTATLFSYEDEIAPIKVLVKALKDATKGSIKAGLLEGELMDDIQIHRLSQLPSKDELRTKVVGSLSAPLYGVVGVLQANLRNLVYALDQIRTNKGGEPT